MSETVEQFKEAMQEEHVGVVARDAAQMIAAELISAGIATEALEKMEPGDDIPLDVSYTSIGRACQLFQLDPTSVRNLAKLAGVKFVASFNRVPHFDGFGIIALQLKLQQLEREQASNE